LKIALFKNCKMWKNKTSLTTTIRAITSTNLSRTSSAARTTTSTTVVFFN